MAGRGDADSRSLEQTPTWAVAIVCLGFVIISILIEQAIHFLSKWLEKRRKKALGKALEKIKAELMLLGFISLLLTVGQKPISEICISKKIGDTFLPCSKKEALSYEEVKTGHCAQQGKVPLISQDGLHQLHIFIFVLAVFHVLSCVMTMSLGWAKMRTWKAWEEEAKSKFSIDPSRFRFTRETTFGRRHVSFWSTIPIFTWIVCFFRQFFISVPKVDYLTLRHGFILAHFSPNATFDFQKYIKRSLAKDFSTVVSISPPLWFFAILFLLLSENGMSRLCWLSFIPLLILLIVGTKLQVIITKMALDIQDRSSVVQGAPVVKPNDQLFWFGRPRLILYLIHFTQFETAFQIAFFFWTWYEYGLTSCFNTRVQGTILKITTGIAAQILCSYVTLPLYALVTQMGSNMRTAIFDESVAESLKKWHHRAKKNLRKNMKKRQEDLSNRQDTSCEGSSSPDLLNKYKSADDPKSAQNLEHHEYEFSDIDADTDTPSPSHHSHYNANNNSKEKLHGETQDVEIGG
ncbi:MLO-like protein 2 [Cryptomeria japonica]|uniref:MLO-like protein 2 n=1 Tax=Cryptomeria japonica TaxID=3369 RepID=UPI0027DA29C6|nr:MLO-like protein 2 [Cryptomeria japonica]